jgi:hypothetical protein
MPQTLGQSTTHTAPITAIMVVLIAFLAVVWYATDRVVETTGREELLTVSIWGISIVAAGIFLVHAWSLAFAIIERERARGAIDRASRLAEQAYDELQALTHSRDDRA